MKMKSGFPGGLLGRVGGQVDDVDIVNLAKFTPRIARMAHVDTN